MILKNSIQFEKEIKDVGKLYTCYGPVHQEITSLGIERMLSLEDIIQNEIDSFFGSKYNSDSSFSFKIREGIIKSEQGFLLVRELPISYLKKNELTDEDYKKMVKEYSKMAKEDAKKSVEKRRVLKIENKTQTFRPSRLRGKSKIISWVFGDNAKILGEELLDRSFYITCGGIKGTIGKKDANENSSFIFCPEVERLGQLKVSLDYETSVREANWLSTNEATFMGYESISYFPKLIMDSIELTKENLENTSTRFLIKEGDEEGLRKIREIENLTSAPDKIEPNKFYSPKEINLYMQLKKLGLK